jgi:hypothetical protein
MIANIAEVAPIPRASVPITTAVNPGCRSADRTAIRRSDKRVEIIVAPALAVPGTPVPPLD